MLRSVHASKYHSIAGSTYMYHSLTILSFFGSLVGKVITIAFLYV